MSDKFKTDGKYYVLSGETIVAKSYVGYDGYEVRTLQGMPRMEVWEKIFNDCPDFAKANGMEANKAPRLFPQNSKSQKDIDNILKQYKLY